MRLLPRDLLAVLLAAALLLAGCGDDDGGDGDTAGDPLPSSTSQAPSDDGAEPSVLTLWSRSNAGGEVDPLAVPLDSAGAIAEFAAQFSDRSVAATLEDEIATLDVPEGQVPAGAVVAIGCDPPTDASIEVTDEGVEVTSPPVKSDKQCLVAVTTIAIVAADPGDL